MRFTTYAGLLAVLLATPAAMGCMGELAGVEGERVNGETFDAVEGAAAVGQGFIWADGILHRTIATPAHFKPGHGPVDVLYNTGGNGTFKDGHEAISESKPGDTDYNGGRWQVMFLKPSVSPTKYQNASADWELDPDDFEPAGVYFVCPLQRPKK